MKNGIGLSCLLWTVFLLLPHGAMAQSLTVADEIRQQFVTQLEAELQQWQQLNGIEIVSHQIQPRVPSGASSLPQCPSQITIESAAGVPFGNLQRRVQCFDKGWSLFVRAKVTVTARLPVAARALKRGEIIGEQDIVFQSVVLSSSDRQLVGQLEDLLGRQVKRQLRRHRAIQINQLSAPMWVNLGDKVIIEARSNGFYANMPGEALESGGEGKGIRVKNLSSGKVIIAYPIAKGRVATIF